MTRAARPDRHGRDGARFGLRRTPRGGACGECRRGYDAPRRRAPHASRNARIGRELGARCCGDRHPSASTAGRAQRARRAPPCGLPSWAGKGGIAARPRNYSDVGIGRRANVRAQSHGCADGCTAICWRAERLVRRSGERCVAYARPAGCLVRSPAPSSARACVDRRCECRGCSEPACANGIAWRRSPPSVIRRPNIRAGSMGTCCRRRAGGGGGVCASGRASRRGWRGAHDHCDLGARGGARAHRARGVLAPCV